MEPIKIELVKTIFEGAYIVKPQVFQDERGFFLENYSKRDFDNLGINIDFVQDNHSMSAKKGVLRGLHFQTPPFAQTKLVRVTKGKAYDVIVDLRKDSPTFGRWQGFEFTAENFLMLLVPKGFAHGFLTLEDNTEFQYRCDEFYHSEVDNGIIWNDPDLKIDWPIVKGLTISEKDKKLQNFKDFDSPF